MFARGILNSVFEVADRASSGRLQDSLRDRTDVEQDKKIRDSLSSNIDTAEPCACDAEDVCHARGDEACR